MTDPRSGPEIAQALLAVHAASVTYWRSFDTATFLAPIGEAWSPADNVRHLTKSIRAVATGLRLPSLVVRLRFGGASAPSRDFSTMRETYRARLAQGANAGKYAPDVRLAPADPEAERSRVMRYHAIAVEEMCRHISRWSERSLDRCRLPHPLLGTLTVREMLFFTLVHTQHHIENVRRRLAATT